MLKRRLIPVLFLKDGWMVRSQGFTTHQYIGDPVHHVRRLVQWNVDELIVLDIGTEGSVVEHHRTDYRFKPVKDVLEFINLIAVECCIPLTFGGRIRSLADIEARIGNGADKVTLNTLLADAPQIVTKAARVFGSQAIVASIDYRVAGGTSRAFVDRATRDTGMTAEDWARRAEDLGTGEILLNAIDRDGQARGFDGETINKVVAATSVPVIACGGAGMQQHFHSCLTETSASAVAAGNIFHFTEGAYPNAKKYLKTKLKDIR